MIYWNGSAIAGARSCDISMDAEMIEVAGNKVGDVREYRAGRKDWSVSVSALVSDLLDVVGMVGKTYMLSAIVRVDTGRLTADRASGYAICKSAKVSGSWGNLVKGTFVFQGSGALERLTVQLRDSDLKDLQDEAYTNLYAVDQ